MTSDLAGSLEIHLDSGSGLASILSTRPLSAAQVFSGRPVEHVVRQLPNLFSLCGTAQAAACVGACEAALGVSPGAPVREVRAFLVQAETVKEHLWRLLLDWPKALGPSVGVEPSMPLMATVMQSFVRARQAVQIGGDPFGPDQLAVSGEGMRASSRDALAVMHELVTEYALGVSPAEWAAEITSPLALERWCATSRTPAARLVRAVMGGELRGIGANPVPGLHRFPLDQLERELDAQHADSFIAAPEWEGQCWETGPIARSTGHPLVAGLLVAVGNGLLARVAALLVELAQAAAALEAPLSARPSDASEPGGWAGRAGNGHAGSGVGIAMAEAARGLLVHRVVVAGGIVQRYQILAPTEWNFHPQGVVAQGLQGIAKSGIRGAELERLANLYITAVDPCVEYRLSVS